MAQMLVLTRKQDGVIRIGENIVIRVIRTGKSSVKIGVDAPASVKVVRGELALRDAQHDDNTAAEIEAELALAAQH
jgi:carbon storage regulator